MNFENEIKRVIERAFLILKTNNLKFRPMLRRKAINPRRGFEIGRTNLRTGLITIDILTPRKREPKKISAILRILCHEVAHHQRPPYRQFYKFKWINRQHYPKFYKQVDKNIKKLKKDKILNKYFI
ncbi:MAG: hypothetical protein U9Q85_03400 [Patescibacteria group bacterium]|nr:hypothetical protein [Patescibacteria group bacterium]